VTDQKAIDGCRKQDRISQKYLFDTYSDGMLMLCVRYVRDLADAEELMLNGFFNFFRHIDRFVYRGQASLVAWLKKIMVNECLMHLRKRKELKIAADEMAAEGQVGGDVLAAMNARDILKLVMALPAGYRTVFNLYVSEGYNHREIAELLGITEGTSKSQLSKARVMLQKMVKENMLL
jgi:RNA polymerase sigma factor (sigma-70 family)